MSAIDNETPIDVVIGLIRSGDDILIAKRPLGRSLAGLWEFPGGKVEAGESEFEALQRELQEEIAITVLDAHHLMTFTHRYTQALVRLIIWEVNQYLGTPHGNESQVVRWVDANSLSDYQFPEGNHEIIAYLQQSRDITI